MEISAREWREMTVDEILNSMETATRVLKRKGLDSPEQVAKALAIIKMLAEQLLEIAA